MPWQRSGLTGPRTVQTVRDSACLQSLKSKHTAQMKAELPFPFDRWEEVPPPLRPPPLLPAHTDSEVLFCGALQQEPSSPLERRNPAFLQGPPVMHPGVSRCTAPTPTKGCPCPHRTHAVPAKSLQPMYTYKPTYICTDTQALCSAWPYTPRKTQDCPLCPWAT